MRAVRATSVRARRGLAAFLLAGVLLCAGNAGATTLVDAREAFQGADFEMALKSLDAYLAGRDISTTDRIEALVLQAQCHARLDNEPAAVKSLCDAMKLDPEWEPDPNRFSPQEMRTFRIALATCPRKPAPPKPVMPAGTAAPENPSWYERKIVWLGVGAAALTAVLLAGGDESNGGDDNGGVPGFPPPPSSPGASWSW